MVTVKLKKNRADDICEIRVSGHANQAEYGKDIVCSAISVLTISTLNGLLEIAKVDVEYSINDGDVKIHILSKNEKSDAILKTYELGIEALLEDYGKYLQLVKKEVQLND